MDFFLYLVACIYFFSPAYCANAAPPLVAGNSRFFKNLAGPIDFNHKFLGAPILGNHKTWRGLLSELIVGTGYFQIFYFSHVFFNLNLYPIIGFHPSPLDALIVGFLLSVGTVFGDLLFAFIKRRLKIKPGQPFIPFDQINYCLGCFIVLQPFYHFDSLFWLIIIPLTFFVHIVFNRIGYNLGLHKAKW
ncbi:MAG: CDP-archaeol synthase [Candidatus Paceibacterota bacterium]|jgi:CDP-2,3-bis-(O-geranylgeranyl)-sn-glycerol synthase|nr:CDP-archaeol synthase [bacterium]